MVAGFRNDPGAHGAAQHAIHEEVPLPPEQMGNLNPGGQQTVNLPPPPAGPRRTSFAAASGTPAPPAYREPAPPTRPSFGPPISEYSYPSQQQQPYVYGWPSDQMQYSSQPMNMYGMYPSDWQQFSQQAPAPPAHTQPFDHVQQQLSQLLISQQDLMQRLNNQASQIKNLTETNDTLYHEKRALELSIEMGTAHKSGRPVSAASERAHISLASLGKRAKAFIEEDMGEEPEKKPKKVDDVSERGSAASEDIDLADCLDKYGAVMGGFPTSAELHIHDCDQKGNMRDWLDLLKLVIGKRYKGLKQFFKASKADMSAYYPSLLETAGFPEHDDLLFRLIDASMSKTSPHAKLIKDRLAAKRREAIQDDDDELAEKLSSGWWLWHTLVEHAKKTNHTKARLASGEFKDKVYFKPNMTEVAVENECNQLRTDYESLPRWQQGEVNGLLHALLDKMPDHASKRREELSEKLQTSEIDGEDAPWEFSKLCEHVAHAVAQVKESGLLRVGAGITTPTPDSKGPYANGPCANCAGPHNHRECQKKCDISGFSWCACSRGVKCWFQMATLPAKLTSALKTPDGKPRTLHPKLDSMTRSKHKKLVKPDGGGRNLRAGAAGADVEEPDEEIEIRVGAAYTYRVGMCDVQLDEKLMRPEKLSWGAEQRVFHAKPAQIDLQPLFIDGGVRITMQIDSGANVPVLGMETLEAIATSTGTARALVKDWKGESTVHEGGTLDTFVKLTGTSTTEKMHAIVQPGADNLISHSALYDLLSQGGKRPVEIRYDPSFVIEFLDTGERSTIIRTNGVYYAVFFLSSTREVNEGYTVARATKVKASEASILWAMRFGQSSAGYLKLRQDTVGLESLSSKLTAETEHIIDDDECRQRAIKRRRPATASRDESKVVAISGHTFQLDGWGWGDEENKKAVACAITGKSYMLLGRDRYDGFFYGELVHRHRVMDDDNADAEWATFCRHIVVSEKALNPSHEVKSFDVDAAGEWRSHLNQAYLEEQLNLLVRVAAGLSHELVAGLESDQRTATVLAICMIQRAGLSPKYFLIARVYALYLINRSVKEGWKISRIHAHTGRAYDATEIAPLLFWTKVTITEDDKKKFKSSPDKRSSTGNVVGISGKKYLIYKMNGSLVTRSPLDVEPLDEIDLLRVGMPKGAAMVDAETETESDGVPLMLVPPPPPAPPAPKQKVIHVLTEQQQPSVGDKLRIYWGDFKGGDGKFWPAEVISFTTESDGEQQTKVRYPDWPRKETFVHNLAKDRDTGLHPWFIVRDKAKKPTPPAPPPPPAASAPVTRARSNTAFQAAVLQAVQHAVSTSPNPLTASCDELIDSASSPLDVYNVLSFVFSPDDDLHADDDFEAMSKGRAVMAEQEAAFLASPSHMSLRAGAMQRIVTHFDAVVASANASKLASSASNAQPASSAASMPASSVGATQSASSAATKPASSAGATKPASSVGATKLTSSVGASMPASSVGATEPASSAGATKPASGVGATRSASSAATSRVSAADIQMLEEVATRRYNVAKLQVGKSHALRPSYAAIALAAVREFIDVDVGPWLRVGKASAKQVEVMTDSGPVMMKAPSNVKEVQADRFAAGWMQADREALHIGILSHGGNKLVPVAEPKSLGIPIADTVTQRTIKTNKSTRRLAKHNCLKSRHCVDGGRLKARLIATNQENFTPTFSNVVDRLTTRMTVARAAKLGWIVACGDVKNAYPRGHRMRPVGYMRLPSTLRNLPEYRAPDGSEMVIALYSPMWGEPSAGYEWEIYWDIVTKDAGWMPAEGVPAMHLHDEDVMIKIVDDFLMISPATDFVAMRVKVDVLAEKLGGGDPLKFEEWPDSFNGYKIEYNRETGAITLSMPATVTRAAQHHLPQKVLDGADDPSIPSGIKLQKLLDSLKLAPASNDPVTREQKEVQEITGELRYASDLLIRVARGTYMLSCIMARSEAEDALPAAKGVLLIAYRHRDDGVTYGGIDGDGGLSPFIKASFEADESLTEVDGIRGKGGVIVATHDGGQRLATGAPDELEGISDATWSRIPHDYYVFAITWRRAVVLLIVKKVAITLGASMYTEGYGSTRCSEWLDYGVTIARALGCPPDGPVLLGSDSRSSLLVSGGQSSATRSRHALLLYMQLQQRVQSGLIRLAHIGDKDMPVDCFTKWTTKEKLEASLAYLTNTRARTAIEARRELKVALAILGIDDDD